jgi:hypothetical protein
MDDQIRERFSARNWEISPTDEKAPDFILRCGIIVSGDSNILLEAIILKRRPIYFASTGQSIDYYGFVKQGICEPACLDYRGVINRLGESFSLEHHRLKAKRYHHTLGTEDEGKSTELVLNSLRKYIR